MIFQVAKDLEDYGNALNRLNEQMQKIQDEVNEEEAEGHNYTLKHINQFQSDHKLCGRKGLRLKVRLRARALNFQHLTGVGFTFTLWVQHVQRRCVFYADFRERHLRRRDSDLFQLASSE